MTPEVAVVQGEIVYQTPPHTYSNLWVIRLDAAGRCTEFTEWWMRHPEPTSLPLGYQVSHSQRREDLVYDVGHRDQRGLREQSERDQRHRVGQGNAPNAEIDYQTDK